MPKPKQRESAARPSDKSKAKAGASDLTEQPLTATSGEAGASAEPGPVAATTGFTPGMGEPGLVEGPSGEEGPTGAVATAPAAPAAPGAKGETRGGAEPAEATHRQRPMPPMPNPVAGLRMAAGIARAFLPPRDRLIFYGGLGAAAALGAVELPVAVAIGAGVWVATHRRGSSQPRPLQPAAHEAEPVREAGPLTREAEPVRETGPATRDTEPAEPVRTATSSR